MYSKQKKIVFNIITTQVGQNVDALRNAYEYNQ